MQGMLFDSQRRGIWEITSIGQMLAASTMMLQITLLLQFTYPFSPLRMDFTTSFTPRRVHFALAATTWLGMVNTIIQKHPTLLHQLEHFLLQRLASEGFCDGRDISGHSHLLAVVRGLVIRHDRLFLVNYGGIWRFHRKATGASVRLICKITVFSPLIIPSKMLSESDRKLLHSIVNYLESIQGEASNATLVAEATHLLQFVFVTTL